MLARGLAAAHVRHRPFSRWVEANRPGTLRSVIPNRCPFDARDPDNTSSADFHIYARRD